MPKFKGEPAAFVSEANMAVTEDPPALLLNKFLPHEPAEVPLPCSEEGGVQGFPRDKRDTKNRKTRCAKGHEDFMPRGRCSITKYVICAVFWMDLPWVV